MEFESRDHPRLLLTLADGTRIVLRPVLPEDRERFRLGFKKLSDKTRFQRFFRGISDLSETDLDYLTQVDQRDHVAWSAVQPQELCEPGIGLGRFVRDQDDPESAEVAFVVIDAFHRRGVGKALMAVLMVRAEEVGVRRLRAIVRPDNDPMINWLANLGAKEEGVSGVVCEYSLPVDCPISCTHAARDQDRLRRALRVQLRRWRTRARLASLGRYLRVERGAS